MTDPSAALAQSVQARLVSHARKLGVDPNLVLTRYATERFLYRLSQSPHAEQFVLKGALLLLVWLGETIRPTRDADLLGYGDMSGEALTGIFRDVCAVEVEFDAMTYLVDSIRVADIRPEDAYGGKRVTLQSRLGKTARLSVQVDVGIGDAVSPEPVWLEYPSLLRLPGARLRAYRPETAIAEKFHAMVTLGAQNSRMRDFFDIDALAKYEAFDRQVLADAMGATFERRGTALPSSLPLALTADFAESSAKQAQWAGFLKRNRLDASENLASVVERLARFLGPLITAGRDGSKLSVTWQAGGPWQPDAGRPEGEAAL